MIFLNCNFNRLCPSYNTEYTLRPIGLGLREYGVLKYTVEHTLKDISEYISVHYTTVSRVIKKIEGEDEK